MNLYLYELKSSWKSMLIWIVCIIGFLVFSMSMFPSFAQNSEATEEMLKNFSPDMLRALGMDVIDFSKPMDYLSYMYQYMLVAVGAFAILIGGSILSKEESDKTIEFLYAKPISRLYMIVSKMSAAITKIIIMTISFYVSVLITMAMLADKVEYASIAKMSLGLFIFMLFFMSIGFILGHFIIKTNKRLPIGLGFLFLLYMTSIITDVSEKYEALRYITPFKYFSGIDLVHQGFTSSYVLISVIVIVLTTTITGLLYQRKDLTA